MFWPTHVVLPVNSQNAQLCVVYEWAEVPDAATASDGELLQLAQVCQGAQVLKPPTFLNCQRLQEHSTRQDRQTCVHMPVLACFAGAAGPGEAANMCTRESLITLSCTA